MLRVQLQLLFDPVLYQQTEAGICHWNTVTDKHLFLGLLCWKMEEKKRTVKELLV